MAVAVPLLVVVLLSVFSHQGVDAQKEECSKGNEFAYDLEDCNKFYTCVGPLSYHMTCSSGLIFSLEQKGCVFKDDESAKDCLTRAAKLVYLKEIEENAHIMKDEEMKSDGDGETFKNGEKKEEKLIEKKFDSEKKETKLDNENISNDEIFPEEMKEENKTSKTEEEDDNGNRVVVQKENKTETSMKKSDGNEDLSNDVEEDDFVIDDMMIFADLPTENDANPVTIDEHCVSGQSIVPHETLCHRYYNCTQSHITDMNRYLTPHEYECPYPKLFSVDTMSCQDFQSVQCGDRMEYVDPCDYTENMCSGPNCKPCPLEHASCDGQPDGRNYWPGREGSGFWVECQGQRTILQGNCAEIDPSMRSVFSKDLKKCVPYSDVIPEVCQWSERRLPHPYECHLFFDCDALSAEGQEAEDNDGDETEKAAQALSSPPSSSSSTSSSSSLYIRLCPYPMLYSVRDGKCMDPTEVDCGSRREAKTPCEYMPAECVDPSFASCEGMADGKNVFRTREGTPHYVICENERTMEKGMCKTDGRGMYKQFSPGTGECMDV